MRAAEAAKARERAAAEAQLKAELDRLKFVATQTRKADESETWSTIRSSSSKASSRASTRRRKSARLRSSKSCMRRWRKCARAAAQQARTAAAEAVATEVARTTAQSNAWTPRRPNVVRMQPRAVARMDPERAAAAPEVEDFAEAQPASRRRPPGQLTTSASFRCLLAGLKPPVEEEENAQTSLSLPESRGKEIFNWLSPPNMSR